MFFFHSNEKIAIVKTNNKSLNLDVVTSKRKDGKTLQEKCHCELFFSFNFTLNTCENNRNDFFYFNLFLIPHLSAGKLQKRIQHIRGGNFLKRN